MPIREAGARLNQITAAGGTFLSAEGESLAPGLTGFSFLPGPAGGLWRCI